MTELDPVVSFESLEVCQEGGVAAEHSVLAVNAKLDEVPGLSDSGTIRRELGLGIELLLVVPIDAEKISYELLHLGKLEARDLEIDLGRLDQVSENLGELLLVPIAPDLVE